MTDEPPITTEPRQAGRQHVLLTILWVAVFLVALFYPKIFVRFPFLLLFVVIGIFWFGKQTGRRKPAS